MGVLFQGLPEGPSFCTEETLLNSLARKNNLPSSKPGASHKGQSHLTSLQGEERRCKKEDIRCCGLPFFLFVLKSFAFFSQPQESDRSMRAVLASALPALVCPSTSCLPLCVHCHGQPRWKGQERCFPPSAAMGGRGVWCCRHCLPPQRPRVQKIQSLTAPQRIEERRPGS